MHNLWCYNVYFLALKCSIHEELGPHLYLAKLIKIMQYKVKLTLEGGPKVTLHNSFWKFLSFIFWLYFKPYEFQIGSNDVRILKKFISKIWATIFNSFLNTLNNNWYWKILILILKKLCHFKNLKLNMIRYRHK